MGINHFANVCKKNMLLILCVCWSMKTNCSPLPLTTIVLTWVNDLLMRKNMWVVRNEESESSTTVNTEISNDGLICYQSGVLMRCSFRILERIGVVSHIKSRNFIMYFHFDFQVFLSRAINLSFTGLCEWCEFHLAFRSQGILRKAMFIIVKYS